MILDKLRIQKSLESFMKTVLYDYEELAMQNPKKIEELRRVRLIINNGSKCYTNDKNIVIGKNFETFLVAKNDNVVYKLAQAVIVHEIAHILYTNFDTFSSFLNKSAQNYKKLSSVSRLVFNILEDYRIENTISKNNSFFRKILLMNRYQVIKDGIGALKKLYISDDEDRASYLLNALLVMGFLKKPFFSNDLKTNQLIQVGFVLMMKALEAKNTEEIVNYSDQIMQLFQKLDIEEYENVDLLSSFEDLIGKVGPTGSRNPLEGIESIKSINSSVFAGEQDFVQDITKNLERMNTKEIDETLSSFAAEIEDEIDNAEKENITDKIVNSFFNDEKQDKAQKVKIENEKKQIQEFRKKLPKQHRTRKLKFRENLASFPQEDYDAIKKVLNFEIKRAVNQIEELKEEKIYNTVDYLRSGTLDMSAVPRFIAFGDMDIFKREYPEEETLEMDVMVLIDCSGSNGSQVLNKKNDTYLPRYKVNQMMAIYIHEILKEVGFKHSIWGFDSGTSENVAPMVTFSDCFSRKSGLKLADISARGSNRDGYHIRLAGKHLDANAKSNKKLLIVVSDGQPNSNGYSGEAAIKDVVDAQEELKKLEIKTIGIFTGSEKENKYFIDMYENHIFLNNDNISDFPKTIHNILVKEFVE